MRCLSNDNLEWLLSKDAHYIYGDCLYFKTYNEYKNIMSNYICHQDIKCFYCIENNIKTGIITFELLKDNTVEIRGIAVHDLYRKIGIGTFMIDESLKILQPKKVIVETDDDAINFYLKYGFEILEKYPDGETCRYKCILNL